MQLLKNLVVTSYTQAYIPQLQDLPIFNRIGYQGETECQVSQGSSTTHKKGFQVDGAALLAVGLVWPQSFVAWLLKLDTYLGRE